MSATFQKFSSLEQTARRVSPNFFSTHWSFGRSAFLATSLLLHVGCVRRVGPATDDNFYIIKAQDKSKKVHQTAAYNESLSQRSSDLSGSITATLKTQAKNSLTSKTSLLNAEFLEKENPEFSNLLEKAKATTSHGSVHFQLARIYQDYRLYEEAQVQYQKAIQLEPKNPLYYEQVARLWRDWGASHLGVNSVQMALQLAPDFVEAWNTLGTLYDRQGMRTKAQESYLKALALNPDLDYVHTNLCYSYLQEESLETAILHGEKAVQLAPTSVVAHNNLGLAYGMHGEFEKAYQEFRQAGDEAVARNNLGLVLLRKNRVADSMREFQLATRLRPFYKVPAENYAAARYLRGGAKRAHRKSGVSNGVMEEASRFESPAWEAVLALLPLGQIGVSLQDLLSSSMTQAVGLSTQLSELQADDGRVVKFEIESSLGLKRQGQFLGEFLHNEHYRLSRIHQNPNRHSRTVIYYQPGFSRSAIELAHRIPGNQIVLRSGQLEQPAELRVALGTDILSHLAKLQIQP